MVVRHHDTIMIVLLCGLPSTGSVGQQLQGEQQYAQGTYLTILTVLTMKPV